MARRRAWPSDLTHSPILSNQGPRQAAGTPGPSITRHLSIPGPGEPEQAARRLCVAGSMCACCTQPVLIPGHPYAPAAPIATERSAVRLHGDARVQDRGLLAAGRRRGLRFCGHCGADASIPSATDLGLRKVKRPADTRLLSLRRRQYLCGVSRASGRFAAWIREFWAFKAHTASRQGSLPQGRLTCVDLLLRFFHSGLRSPGSAGARPAGQVPRVHDQQQRPTHEDGCPFLEPSRQGEAQRQRRRA